MEQDLENIEFTIFDTETTGLLPEEGDRIVELAAMRFKGNEVIAVMQTLLNPEREISPAAFAVNRITRDELKDAPKAAEILPGFLEFIHGSCLCSYNACFDLGFLHNELKLIGKILPGNIVVIDILTMAKRLKPGLERYALWYVAQELAVSIQQKHRALADVEITLEVFRRLKNIMEAKQINNFSSLVSLCGVNSRLSDDLNSQKIARIQEAISQGLTLRLKYFAGVNAEVSEREVVPKEIKQDKNRYYLVGYCNLRNEERTFRIDGILHLEVV